MYFDTSNRIKVHAYLYDLLKKLIKEVRRKNVVQIVISNGSVFVKARKMLMECSNMYWTPCVVHCIDLFFKDIGKKKKEQLTNGIKQAKTITNYIYNYNWLLAKMHETCKRDVVRLRFTWFSINYQWRRN